MSDEGIGIYIAEEIGKRNVLPADIEATELGTGNMNVLHAIAGREKVVFVDCAKMGGSPGTMRRFGLDEVVSKKVLTSWSAHEGDLLNLLEISRTMGELPAEVVIFGIEPAKIEFGQQLTPALRACFGGYVAEITNFLQSLCSS